MKVTLLSREARIKRNNRILGWSGWEIEETWFLYFPS
jgi:hypothetical protein